MGVPIDEFNTNDSFELEECTCCGSESVIKRKNVNILSPSIEKDHLNIRVCMICGDSKTVEEFEDREYTVRRETYQISMEKSLQKVERHPKEDISKEEVIYIYNDDEIGEPQWQKHLEMRRNVLRSVVIN